MRHVEMKIKSYVLEDLGYSASIEYFKDDKGSITRAFIYDNNKMDEYDYPIWEKEFETMDDAIESLETECELLIVEELKHRAFKGRRAQEKLDEIKENGFKF